MEENLEKLENRYKTENTSLAEFYGKKIDALQAEKTDIEIKYSEKLVNLQNTHEAIIEKIKNQHTEELDDIRKDNRNMIENLR